MFDPDPKARADMKPGALYAVSGDGDWIYYGQIAPDQSVGFFRRRDRRVAAIEDVMSASIMSVVIVNYPSIGHALRSGAWKKLGRFPVVDQLKITPLRVQWPVGTLTVTVHSDGIEYDTNVADPSIQNLEVIAVWDAECHVPKRLKADFEQGSESWKDGGTVLQNRLQKESRAKLSPDMPWHALPPEWVPVNAS